MAYHVSVPLEDWELAKAAVLSLQQVISSGGRDKSHLEMGGTIVSLINHRCPDLLKNEGFREKLAAIAQPKTAAAPLSNGAKKSRWLSFRSNH